MSRPTVWLRRDPVGAHTRLPARDEFRGRFARRTLLLGPLALLGLGVLVGLRAQNRWGEAWPWLLVAVFWLGIAGIAAAAVASRTPRFRARAATGAGLSFVALVGVLYVDSLADALE